MPKHYTYEFVLSMMTKGEYDSLDSDTRNAIPGFEKKMNPENFTFAADKSKALTMDVLLNIAKLDDGDSRICNTSKATFMNCGNDAGRKFIHTDNLKREDILEIGFINTEEYGPLVSFLLTFVTGQRIKLTESGKLPIRELMEKEKASSQLLFKTNDGNLAVFSVQLKNKDSASRAEECSHSCGEGKDTQRNSDAIFRDILVEIV